MQTGCNFVFLKQFCLPNKNDIFDLNCLNDQILDFVHNRSSLDVFPIFNRLRGRVFWTFILAALSVVLVLSFALRIALFTVIFSHLHYNVILRGCEANLGLNFKIAMLDFIVMQNEEIKLRVKKG